MVQLSKPQEDAVKYIDGLAVVTAGAGSGKTRVLTNKIEYLVNELDYSPSRILAITFTNKAAEEMKTRLNKSTGLPASEFPWVRTFHSACFQILKRYCDILGYETPIVIHSDYQQDKNLKKVLIEEGLKEKEWMRVLASAISLAKNSKDPLEYLANRKHLPKSKFTLYHRYNEVLKEQNAVDFDDILMLVRDLFFTHDDILQRYRHFFQYILVDEFQDSNEVQNQITHALAKDGNLTVVGDDYQSIYTFRGANPKHFINFAQTNPGAKLFKLEENYRSTVQIVGAADALIAKNLIRLEKTCFSVREGDLIDIHRLLDDETEAKWVAGKCLEYKRKNNIEFRDIAVLYRTKFCSYHFEKAMRNARIPYRMLGGVGFFQRREIQDLNAYLICAVNDKDNASFERIINVPKRGMGEGTINKLTRAMGTAQSLQGTCRKAIEERLVSKKNIAGLNEVFNVLETIKNMPPHEAINKVMEMVEYPSYLESFCEDEELESRLDNIRQLTFVAAQHKTIASYLEDVALVNEDKEEDKDKKDDKVRLSTIHGVKGLEYKLVFVVAAEDGLLPHSRSLDGSPEGIEEERRLMYVAMTRAADHLYITSASARRGQPSSPSRFIYDIPSEFISKNGKKPTPDFW